MDQTTWVINALDDSNRRSIEYENRFWLRQNVKEMNIRVCAEACEVNLLQLVELWVKEGTIFIQDGQKVESGYDFRKDKEALVLIKGDAKYSVFIYYPEE